MLNVLRGPGDGEVMQLPPEDELVLVSGGLGPTEDDLTRECVAAALGREVNRDPELITELYKRFAKMRPAPTGACGATSRQRSLRRVLGSDPRYFCASACCGCEARPG